MRADQLQKGYAWYANRTRGIRRRTATHGQASASAVEVESVPPSLPEARRPWAELLRRIFEVDPLRCPRCGHEMRIVAFITQPRVSDRILTHLRRIATEPRRSRAQPRRWKSPHTTTSASAVAPPRPPPPDPWVRGLLGCAHAGWWPWPCLIPAARLARGR